MPLPLHHGLSPPTKQRAGTRGKRQPGREVSFGLIASAMLFVLAFAGLLYAHSLAALAALTADSAASGSLPGADAPRSLGREVPTFRPGFVPWLDEDGKPIQAGGRLALTPCLAPSLTCRLCCRLC